MTDRERIQFFTDPGCPWAWRAAHWMREVRNYHPVEIDWDILSLEEMNRALGQDEYVARQSQRRPALRAMALAKMRYGNDAFERLYFALADARHGREGDLGDPALVDACVREAGLPETLREEALADPATEKHIMERFKALQAEKAFGVPTIVFEGHAPIFGPVIDQVPRGDSAVDLWEHFRALATRPEFFEIKRIR